MDTDSEMSGFQHGWEYPGAMTISVLTGLAGEGRVPSITPLLDELSYEELRHEYLACVGMLGGMASALRLGGLDVEQFLQRVALSAYRRFQREES
jgi:hypothetical protein